MPRNALVAPASLVALVLAVAAPAALAGGGGAKATSVSVTMTDFKFKLSKSSVPKGKVTFKLANKGTASHDFKVNGKKSPLVAASKTSRFTVTFPRAGSFKYLCTVPGHAALGMKGTLRVK
jgi:plastocyanin